MPLGTTIPRTRRVLPILSRSGVRARGVRLYGGSILNLLLEPTSRSHLLLRMDPTITDMQHLLAASTRRLALVLHKTKPTTLTPNPKSWPIRLAMTNSSRNQPALTRSQRACRILMAKLFISDDRQAPRSLAGPPKISTSNQL